MNEDLKAKLIEAGIHWKESLRDVGMILKEMEDDGQPIRQIIHEVLYGQCGMPKATAVTALRWAKGELGSDEEANLLVSRISDSKLASWSPQAIREAVQNEHMILADCGRSERKHLREMTQSEVSRNTGVQGFIPISESMSDTPEHRRIYARDVIEENGEIIAVSKGRETIYVILTTPILEKINKLSRAVCTA